MGLMRHAMSDKSIQKAVNWLDTVQKGKDMLELIQSPIAYDRIVGLFELYPETKEMSHVSIAYLLGMARETITRELNGMDIYRRKVA